MQDTKLQDMKTEASSSKRNVSMTDQAAGNNTINK